MGAMDLTVVVYGSCRWIWLLWVRWFDFLCYCLWLQVDLASGDNGGGFFFFFFFLGGLWWWVDVASGGGFFYLFFAMVCDVG